MFFQKLAIVAALTALVAAQEITQDDIPQQCNQICAQVVKIANDCNNQHNDDNAELQCICNAANASTLLPNCEACVAQYDNDDDDDDDIDSDVREVLTRCNFAVQSSFNSASASSVASAATTGSVVVTTTSGTAVVTSTSTPSGVSQAGAPAVTAAAGMGFGALGLALGML
ncbi:hypothetical protein N0V86_005166 [Didymella sp. IMI 355093]|nr:hypothetical protein N0V86_005166 [Didymella sp. IMI 355093]